MLSAESFWTYSLRLLPEGGSITRILLAAISALEPGSAVTRHVARDGDMLVISGQRYDLRSFNRVIMLGIGKASLAMSDALAFILADRLSAGLVISKHPSPYSNSLVTHIIGGHPIPDENSLKAGKKVIELLASLGPKDLLICLISGGGSALVTAPINNIILADIQSLTSTLLTCGARIDELNTIRRRLDLLKGGGVVKIAAGATVISLILSDVVSNPLEAIASGPTAPDPTTKMDAFNILAKYGLEKNIPFTIQQALNTFPETPKPGDLIFSKVQNLIVGSNLHAAQAALTQAEVEGFHPYLYSVDLQGEARLVAFKLATMLRQASLTGDPVSKPFCIVAGGEMTVTLKGNGKGGRNSELALASVSELAEFPGVALVTLATDGEDGSTDAAGAVVIGDTFRRAGGMGLRPMLYLDQNDSYSFFSALDDLIKPGSTGTNGNDLVFLFNFK